ncbi:major facilitator superfamily domain-containing protein [Aspergillus sergii]|uniref:Major facilitator superfamily domain-containing protein n=1 Tax=Aspergillus sergii TaxID=1034303 RepID=A0A5N6XLC5_9EURO|nr:major facilitator superfamily domain-containing protein [Aspergillus sergii]
MHTKRGAQPWYHWFTETDTPQDRKLLIKLDLLILPYAFIGFWINYIDSSNINNAWVAGLAHDLDFHGNQLVDFQTIYQVGSVIGQVPIAFLFPILPMNWLIPGMEFCWGIFTLLQYRASSYSEFMAYRFLVGLFEAPFFIGVHYVLGSWYRADELGRRGGIFFIGMTLGASTASLIQSGASAHLQGVSGLAGWRWMYIIVALMTLVVAIAGFFIWPGTPDIPNKLFLSDEDIALARKRMEENGTGASNNSIPKFSLRLLKSVITDWEIYVLTWWNVLFWNSDAQVWGGYLLWIESLGRYSAAQINSLGSSAPAVGILYVLFINFSSDLWLGRTGAIVLSHLVNIICTTILVIWNVPESAKWFASNIYYCGIGMSSVLYGWANDILRHNKQARAITLVAMNIAPTAVRAWIGLLVFKTVESPRFTKGYSFCLANSIVLIGWTFLVRHLYHKQEKRIDLESSRSSGSIEQVSQISENIGPFDHKVSVSGHILERQSHSL